MTGSPSPDRSPPPGQPLNVTRVWLFWSDPWSCCELVVADVVALAFLLDVVGPVGAEVAVGFDGAQAQDGFGACQAPACAGDAEAVGDQVAAGSLDDCGGDGPAAGQGAGVVQVGELAGQVAECFADLFFVLAAGCGGMLTCQRLDQRDDLPGVPVQDRGALRGDPGFEGRVAGGVECPAGFPQVFQDVDEVDQDGDGRVAGRGFPFDHGDLVAVAVDQDDPGALMARVAAGGLAENLRDGGGAVSGDIGGIPAVDRPHLACGPGSAIQVLDPAHDQLGGARGAGGQRVEDRPDLGHPLDA